MCEILSGMGLNPGVDRLFQVVVEIFIGVQLGSVRRKIEDLDRVTVILKSLGYLLAVVGPQVVEDEKDLSFGVLGEAGHEGDEPRRGHRLSGRA